jgi:hypothetical protein
MAINLAEKYEKKVQERFTTSSKTDSYCGHDYTFEGVNSINIYSIDTVPLVDYTRSGTSRFGDATELGDTKQTLVLTGDKAFNFTIDKGNNEDQLNIKQASACLKRELDEVVTPYIDKTRFEKWIAGNGLTKGTSVTTVKDGVLTKANILERIFTANAQMNDDLVPAGNRVLFIPELTFLKFKLSDVVTGSNDALTTENVRKGYRGTIDGIPIVTVPSVLWPESANFILKYKNATVDVFKLKDYRIHKDPPGISGNLVEGRIIFDSFVLDTRAKGIYVSSTATA